MNFSKMGKSFPSLKLLNRIGWQQHIRNSSKKCDDFNTKMQEGFYGKPCASGGSKASKSLKMRGGDLSALKGGRGSGLPFRPMKFPYTFAAKIAQFPLKYYIDNQWIWKYYFIGILLCTPVFFKISRMANSPGNKEKWAESKKRELAEHEGHDH